MKRRAGLFQVVMYGVGNIIGAGIYVLVGDAAALSGTAVWLSFLLAAVVALFTGLTYAELSSMYPKAASEYVYLGRAYGSKLLSFLTGWTMLATELVAASAVALGFAGYLDAFVGAPIILVAAILLATLTLVSIAGAEQWLRLNSILSGIAILGLVVVVFLGLGRIGTVDYSQSSSSFTGIIGGAALVFFAFIGFDNMSNIAEDTKIPEKTIPRGLIISLAVTTVLYVMVGLAAVSLVPPRTLGSSEAPLALAVSKVLGPVAFDLMSMVALLTTLNTVLVLLVVSSRIIYGMAKEGALPRRLGIVSRRTGSPVVASLTALFIALAFVPLGSVVLVARVTSFGSLATFALVNVAMLHLRRTAPRLSRPFKAPLNLGRFSLTAFLGLVSCLAFLSQFDLVSAALGLGLFLSGLIVYALVARTGLSVVGGSLHQPHES